MDHYWVFRFASPKSKNAWKSWKTKSAADWDNSKLLRNEVNNLHNKLKANDIQQQIDENRSDPRWLWQTLKTLLPGKNQTDIPAVKTSNGLVNDKQQVADVMNNFFSTVGEELAKKFGPCDSSTGLVNSTRLNFKFHIITVDQVFKLLQSLDSRKATGLDGVSSRLIKAGAASLAYPLTSLFNLSLSTGEVPQQWKTSRVTHIFSKKAQEQR